MIVMDEADKLLSEDFVPVVERLLALCAPTKQISLFSATFPVTVKDFKVRSIEWAFEYSKLTIFFSAGEAPSQPVHCQPHGRAYAHWYYAVLRVR